jgi:hypothetical protein
MKHIFFVIFAIFLVSCDKSDEQKADEMLQRARALYVTNNVVAAKACIDSLHAVYPQQVKYRRQADTLLWAITVKDITAEIPIVDSALQHLMQQAEILAKNHKFIKNEKYQLIGDYEHTTMSNALNTGRTYIKPITDEEGNFRLISSLTGKSIKHKSIEVSNGVETSETEVINDTEFNHYNDYGVNYELANFSEHKSKNFILFLQRNKDKPLKITLKGTKKFSYNLTKNNLKAILETFELSNILKEIHKNQQKKVNMEKTMEIICNRLSAEDKKL